MLVARLLINITVRHKKQYHKELEKMSFFSTKVAYASESLNQFLGKVDTMILNPLIVLLFALALIYFLYGVFEFVSGQDNDEKKTTGKSHMIWGVIGLTIMMGVWFIMGVILNTLGISSSQINPQEGTVNLPDYVPPSPNNLPN